MTLKQIYKKTCSEYFSIPDEETESAFGQRKPIGGDVLNRSPAKEKFYQEHLRYTEIVPSIEHTEIGEDVVLRRFMDLPKFIDLIVNKRLLLPTVKKLQEGDPHECEASPDYSRISDDALKKSILDLAEEYVTEADLNLWRPLQFDLLVLGQRQPVTKSSVSEVLDKMSQDELRQAAWCVEHRRLQDELCCNCWYDSELESDAMWRLYCDRVGVSIATTVKTLQRSIKCEVPMIFKDRMKLHLAKVTYSDASTVSDAPSWLIKRSAFRHEHEVRFFIDYPFPRNEGFVLTVEPLTLIEEMTVSPYAPRWQANAIEAMARRILGDGLKIKASKHRNSLKPPWPQR
jgi:hypothetical protein